MWVPAGETYLVRPDELERHNLVPKELLDQYYSTRSGTVVSAGVWRCGDGSFASLRAKVGDKVCFGTKVGSEIKVDGENLLLVADANILLIEQTDQPGGSRCVN